MLLQATGDDAAPEVGELVRVRGQQWVVNRRKTSTQPRDELAPDLPGRTMVTLTSVSDDDRRYGIAELSVFGSAATGADKLYSDVTSSTCARPRTVCDGSSSS